MGYSSLFGPQIIDVSGDNNRILVMQNKPDVIFYHKSLIDIDPRIEPKHENDTIQRLSEQFRANGLTLDN
jgi:hypothetical protein